MTDVTIASDSPRQLGIVRDYDQMLNVIRAHIESLNISRATIDYASGTQSGYAAKVFGPKPLKRMGPTSMPLILEALGLRLAVEIDPEATARITSRMAKREVSNPVRALPWGKARSRVVSKRWVRRIAREGGRARALALTPKQRSASARKAAKARWKQAEVG
jgi:hypothetical protein